METTKNVLALACTVCMLLCALYMGITNDLCSRINTFDTEAQRIMKLDTAKCNGPWFKRF